MRTVFKNLPKVLSLCLCVAIICGITATAAYTAGAENGGSKSESSSAKDGKFTKNETVYVIADAKGTPDKIIVSDWIKNSAGAQKIADKTNLKDIKNTKGDEKYTLNDDNMCVWDANGKDIYYQGTSKKDLPVDLSVSYRLDGKTISPDELKGKSGKVTIRFDYKNKQYENVVVNGKKTQIYVPFVMLTGMMLDNEKFSNVEVNHGKVINDGSHTIVAGFATPGLDEDLDLESDELDFPDYVEIKADVKDFTLATTMTVATNDVFKDVDFSGADKKIDELDKKFAKLTDATDKLIDGSSQLYNGISKMLSKSSALIDGVKSLVKGAKQLSGGADKLNSGAKKLDKGAKKIKKGAKKLDKGAGSLKDGISTLQSGVTKLAGGLGTLSSKSSTLNSGAKKVFESLLSAADTQIAASGVKAEKLTITNYPKVLNKIKNSLSDDALLKVANKTALETVTKTVRAQESLIKAQVEAAVKQEVLAGVLKAAGLGMSVEEYNKAVAAGLISDEVKAKIEGGVNQQMNSDKIKNTISQKTEEQVQKLIKENMNSETVRKQIQAGIKKGQSGAAAISKLKKQLDDYNKFYNGVCAYTSGVNSAKSGADKLSSGSSLISSGAATLKSGTKALKKGTGTLRKGTKNLKKGTKKLASGAKKLFGGMSKLSGGTNALIGGVKQLKDGSFSLNKGLKTYKEKGIDTIVKTVNGDVKGLFNRLKAIAKVNSRYKSFSGISSDMDGKVDFIYKTAGIE